MQGSETIPRDSVAVHVGHRHLSKPTDRLGSHREPSVNVTVTSALGRRLHPSSTFMEGVKNREARVLGGGSSTVCPTFL